MPTALQKEKPRARTALDDGFAMQLVNAVSNVNWPTVSVSAT
jgi:hypothetical protein